MDDRDDGADDDGSADVRIGSTAASSTTDGGVPELDEFLRLLSNRRRRYALYYLRERDLRDRNVLARYVAAELAGTAPEAVPDEQVAEVETMFVHVDVPMLEDTGVVSSDPRTGTLRFECPAAAIDRLLDACAALDGIDPSDRGRSGGVPDE